MSFNECLNMFIVGQRLRPGLMGLGGRIPVAYLYNGERLPALPDWDKTKYPYATITKIHTGGGAEFYNVHLCFSDTPMVKLYSWTDGVYPDSDDNNCAYESHVRMQSVEPAVWEYHGPVEDSNPYLLPASVIWANYDVIDKITGEVFCPASDPVPVYE